MTCREKLKELHPDWSQEELFEVFSEECPVDHMNIRTPKDAYGNLWCVLDKCDKCWDREVPGTEPLTYEHTGDLIGKVTEVNAAGDGFEFKVERTNSMTGHPCHNCNTGWGSISSDGYVGCEDTCEHLKEYMNRNIEKEKNMATTKKTKSELLEELENVKKSKEDLEKELKNLEKYKQYEDMAGEVHAIYMSFVHAGFSEGQAYDLLKTMIQNAANITFNTSIEPRYKKYR